MKISSALFFLSAGILQLACTSSHYRYQNTEFATRISNSGLKHFQVSAQTPAAMQQRNTPGSPAQQNEGMPSPARVKSILIDAADAHIALNRFCRSGYWVLDLDAHSPTIRLRGECNEKASQEEREKFPDTISQW